MNAGKTQMRRHQRSIKEENENQNWLNVLKKFDEPKKNLFWEKINQKNNWSKFSHPSSQEK